ncbi:hypothetical protein TIFTF001_019663 [Ficus carica]|uniref:Uncharacterized protein n=1 Tax=Ficus carica TaxID=3494 RepID=A0AA88ADE2_FICCA|nr:hypothetical protein TIFTF001_019663 [Ficus carica]
MSFSFGFAPLSSSSNPNSTTPSSFTLNTAPSLSSSIPISSSTPATSSRSAPAAAAPLIPTFNVTTNLFETTTTITSTASSEAAPSFSFTVSATAGSSPSFSFTTGTTTPATSTQALTIGDTTRKRKIAEEEAESKEKKNCFSCNVCKDMARKPVVTWQKLTLNQVTPIYDHMWLETEEDRLNKIPRRPLPAVPGPARNDFPGFSSSPAPLFSWGAPSTTSTSLFSFSVPSNTTTATTTITTAGAASKAAPSSAATASITAGSCPAFY